MEKVRFISHKGKEILLLDFENASVDDVKTISEQGKALIRQQPEKSLLTLTNATNLQLTSETTQTMKDLAAHNKPYVIAGGVLGVEGLRKVVFNTVLRMTGRNLRAFNTQEEAMDWLVQQ